MFIYRTYNEENKNIASHKLLARAVLNRAFLDSLGHLTNSSYCGKAEKQRLQDSAKFFIDSSDTMFIYWCDLAELEPDYVVRKYHDLQYVFNTGKLKGINLQTFIEEYINRL